MGLVIIKFVFVHEYERKNQNSASKINKYIPHEVKPELLFGASYFAIS